MKKSPGRLRVPFAGLMALSVAWAAAQEFEEPPVLQARDVLDTSLLEGPHHQIDDEVRNDGLMNHFVLRSDYGDLEAASEEMLEIRIREVHALTRLSEISRSQAFTDALKSSAMAPVNAVKNVVTDPVATAKGIPSGLGRTFRGLYYKGRKTAHKVEDELKGTPKADPTAAGSETGEPAAGPTGAEIVDKSEKAVKSFVGYNSALRDLARRLQVDPYTSNELLKKELDRLAGAAFSAGLSFKLVVPSVSVISYAEEVSELVYSTPPDELERLNDQALKKMGVAKAVRLDFFENRAFTPSLDTGLVEALKRLDPVSGRGLVVDLALAAASELEARYFVRMAWILAGHHGSVAALERLVLAGNDEVGRLVAAVTEGGKLVVPAAVDYLTWQPGMDRRGPLYEFEDRELWIAGGISQLGERELKARGWHLETRVLERFESTSE